MSTSQVDHESFGITFSVDRTPEEVFHAINDVRGWWSEDIDGSTDKLHDEFTYRHRDIHCCQIRVTEAIPGKRVTWLVLDNYFTFTEDKREWQGTEIQFEIIPKGEKTEVRFRHLGLVSDYECFDICSNSWDFYMNTSLRGLIGTGQGLPNQKEQEASI
jgi:hypothetical protein